MRLELKTRNLKLSRALSEEIHHMGLMRLDHLTSRIKAARLQLSDVNATRGGIDKMGRLTLMLENGSHVYITGKHSGVMPLAASLFDRAAEAVSRFFGRMRENRR
jgi:hypothetical protein